MRGAADYRPRRCPPELFERTTWPTRMPPAPEPEPPDGADARREPCRVRGAAGASV